MDSKKSIQKSANTFIHNIRFHRQQCGLSLEELSNHSGVQLSILEQLENNSLPEEMLVTDAFDLAKVFQCKVYELFE